MTAGIGPQRVGDRRGWLLFEHLPDELQRAEDSTQAADFNRREAVIGATLAPKALSAPTSLIRTTTEILYEADHLDPQSFQLDHLWQIANGGPEYDVAINAAAQYGVDLTQPNTTTRDTTTHCAPDGQHCAECNGVHNPKPGVTFVTSRHWTTTNDHDTDTALSTPHIHNGAEGGPDTLENLETLVRPTPHREDDDGASSGPAAPRRPSARPARAPRRRDVWIEFITWPKSTNLRAPADVL